MKPAKKINAVALIASVLISGTAIAAATVLTSHNSRFESQQNMVNQVSVSTDMPVVVITGKRMTAAEKAAALE